MGNSNETLKGIQEVYQRVSRMTDGLRFGAADGEVAVRRDALVSRAGEVRTRLATVLKQESRRMFGALPEFKEPQSGRMDSIELPCGEADLNNMQMAVEKAELMANLLELSRRIRIRTEPMYRKLHPQVAPLVSGSPEMRKRIRETDERAAELSPKYREMMELFGENFLMIGAVDEAFTLEDGTKLTDMPMRARQITEVLKAFLDEPGIEVFIVKLIRGEAPGGIPKEGWHLRLDIPYLNIGEEHPLFVEGEYPYQPITLSNLQRFLEPDMIRRGQGHLFGASPEGNNAAYGKEGFFCRDNPILRVTLGTNGLIPGSVLRDASDKEILAEFEAKAGLKHPYWGSERNGSSPISIAYKHFLLTRTTGKGLPLGQSERAAVSYEYTIDLSPPHPAVVHIECVDPAGVLLIHRSPKNEGAGLRSGLSYSRRSERN